MVPPLKNAGYKITLDSNRMPPQLTVLFDDLVSNSVLANDLNQRSAANNVLTFQYFSGHDVTILVSKSAGRYRLQSGKHKNKNKKQKIKYKKHFAGSNWKIVSTNEPKQCSLIHLQ